MNVMSAMRVGDRHWPNHEIIERYSDSISVNGTSSLEAADIRRMHSHDMRFLAFADSVDRMKEAVDRGNTEALLQGMIARYVELFGTDGAEQQEESY